MCALINIFLIASMVQAGMAIKCFICDSAMNEQCADISDKKMVTEECTLKNLGNFMDHNMDRTKQWLLHVSSIPYTNSMNNDTPMTCQKIVGIDENKNRTIVRRCQLKNINACNYTTDQVSADRSGKKIEDCSLCDNDNGCNGSSTNAVFGMMIGVVATITICIHLIL